MLVLLATLSGLACATTINNMAPRLDVNGDIVDAHDFTLRKYPASVSNRSGYYMVAVAYGGCVEPAGQGCDQTADHCGFQQNHSVNVWYSDTLASGSWEFLAVAVAPDQRPAGTVYRPDAIFNPNTQQMVLWHNWVHPSGAYAGYAAYTAPSIEGPYTLQRQVVNLTVQNPPLNDQCGDFHLFVDPVDNTPYVIMGCGYHMYIEKLAPSMLDSAGDASPLGRFVFTEYFVEAPALFVRNGLYYAVFDSCCCYCMQGSGAVIHTAPHPLGPWTIQPSIPADPFCASVLNDAYLTLQCSDPGATIQKVAYASYGTSEGTCPGWTTGACNAVNSTAVVEALCLGKNACTVPATNAVFGDPCVGTVKHLDVVAHCSSGNGLQPNATNPGEVGCEPITAVDIGQARAPTRVAALLTAQVGGVPTAGQGCQYLDSATTSVMKAQQSNIFPVDLSDGTQAWIWAGDRWQQSWDGTKGHDPQFWAPLVFDAAGNIGMIRWIDNFTLPVV